jgi:hypothetical protein
MPTVIPNRYAHCTTFIQGPNVNTDCAVTFGLYRAPVSASADASKEDMFDSFRLASINLWSASLGQGYTLNGLRMVGREDGDLYQFDAGLSLTGASTNPIAPPQVALLVKKTTNGAGRKNRGRMYLPGIIERTAIDGSGQVAAGYLAAVQGRLDTFLDELENGPVLSTADAFHMVVLHGDATTPTRVTSLRAQALMATQRRRIR